MRSVRNPNRCAVFGVFAKLVNISRQKMQPIPYFCRLLRAQDGGRPARSCGPGGYGGAPGPDVKGSNAPRSEPGSGLLGLASGSVVDLGVSGGRSGGGKPQEQPNRALHGVHAGWR